jgi:hypothetical protein
MPRAGARAGATGDAGGAAGGKVRSTEAQTNNRECPVSTFNFRVEEEVRCHQSPVGQSDRTILRSRNFTDPPCSAASFEVNSEPHTEARPSVRLCVGLNKSFKFNDRDKDFSVNFTKRRSIKTTEF